MTTSEWWRRLAAYPPTWLAALVSTGSVVGLLAWFSPGPVESLLLVGAGGVSLAAWPAAVLATGTLRRRHRRELERVAAEADVVPALTRQLALLPDRRPLEQLQSIQRKSENLAEVLGRRLDAGEMTYARYLGTTEQVVSGVLRNLSDVAVSYESIRTVKVDDIERRLLVLGTAAGPAADRERDSLQARLSLVRDTQSRIDDLLAQNESALTALVATTTSVSAIPASGSDADVEAAMTDLDTLARRVAGSATGAGPGRASSTGGGDAGEPLHLELDVARVQAQLDAGPSDQSGPARQVLDTLLAVDTRDYDSRQAATALVDGLGRQAQATASRRTRQLSLPIAELSHDARGGAVESALAALRDEVAALDPAALDADRGGRRGSAVDQYVQRFRASQPRLDTVEADLRRGRDQLRRDTDTLLADQRGMRDGAQDLAEAVDLAASVRSGLEQALAGPLAADEPRRAFLADDVLTALLERSTDLSEQLTVTQQGVLALEILVANNRELARGVDKALDVTVSARTVAATVVVGLAQRQQVRQDAAATSGDVGALRQALGTVGGTLDEIDRYRAATADTVSDSLLDLSRPVDGRQPEDRIDTRGTPS